MAWQDTADSAVISQLLAVFDHKPEWRQAKPPNTIRTIRGFQRQFGSDESELINAYGVRGCEVVCEAASFGGDQPEKFDQFIIDGQKFTIQMVRPTKGFRNRELLFRCFCKGG